jgi:hypothetical protein
LRGNRSRPLLVLRDGQHPGEIVSISGFDDESFPIRLKQVNDAAAAGQNGHDTASHCFMGRHAVRLIEAWKSKHIERGVEAPHVANVANKTSIGALLSGEFAVVVVTPICRTGDQQCRPDAPTPAYENIDTLSQERVVRYRSDYEGIGVKLVKAAGFQAFLLVNR